MLNVSQRNLPEPDDPVMKQFWEAGYLGYHFTGIKRTVQYKLIRCSDISSRLVFVENGDDSVDGYVSSVLRNYQHD